MDKNKLICRKCGGNHLTMKCGKDKVESVVEKEIIPEIKEENKELKQPRTYKNDNTKSFSKPRIYKKGYSVKVSDLPMDITERELMELTSDWGNILKIRVNNYEQNSTAYIDFEYEDQANYFVESLDRTPFDSIIINVSRC